MYFNLFFFIHIDINILELFRIYEFQVLLITFEFFNDHPKNNFLSRHWRQVYILCVPHLSSLLYVIHIDRNVSFSVHVNHSDVPVLHNMCIKSKPTNSKNFFTLMSWPVMILKPKPFSSFKCHYCITFQKSLLQVVICLAFFSIFDYDLLP